MKVHLRDLKDGPFEIDEFITDENGNNMDERIHDIRKIKANAKGHKFSDNIVLDVSLDAHIRVDCDRCAEEITHNINDAFSILLTKNENMTEFNHKDFDIVVEIKEDDIEVDLTQYIYEGINVSLPMRIAPVENENGECSECKNPIDFNSEGSNQPEHHRAEFEKLKNLFK